MRSFGIPLALLCCGLFTACGREPQSAACAQFVGCVRALDAQDGRRTNTLRFEENGGCWGGPAGAKLCTDACVRGLEVARREATAPAACAAVAP